MKKHYSIEKNVQVLLALLKAHGIRKIIASPGATNVTLVASMQQDTYFQIYSSVDERSAAYMACGLAEESGEPVVLTCTGATASRNYLPGLTEAYYRKLPVLAITSTQAVAKVGHLVAQVIDRSTISNDVAKLSVTLPIVKDEDDIWECEIKVNKAILELKRHGGGSVHINIPTTYSQDFSIKELPNFRKIDRITPTDTFPKLPEGKIAIFVGSHPKWTNTEEETIDKFCAYHDAVIFCDHTSSYKGKYRVQYSLFAGQIMFDQLANSPDILIHIGEITGDYYSLVNSGKQIWRVSEDGEIRDTFRKLRYVFEMKEQSFFEHYIQDEKNKKEGYLQICKSQMNDLYSKIPELPFSNIWIASKLAPEIPKNSTIHFGILNSLRSWNFFELPQSVLSSSNVGGFGIDGGLSSLIGASLVNEKRLYFGILGDLAFFYDMNALGNRHIKGNIRILLINNGKGTEFKLFNHRASQFDNETDQYIAAAGHFGNKSKYLVKHYAEDLGFEYLSAINKEEFQSVYKQFLTVDIKKSILFEVFTDDIEENLALEIMLNIEENIKIKAKQITKQLLGEKGISVLKKVVRK